MSVRVGGLSLVHTETFQRLVSICSQVAEPLA